MATSQDPKLRRQEIALYAYLIWEKEGYPHGRDIDHWFQAETLLSAAKQLSFKSLKTTSSHKEASKSA